MATSQNILSEIVIFNKYAKFIPELNRRETWEEICQRNMQMHIHKYPQVKTEIQNIYKNFILTKKVLPSMRSLQFAGASIELSNNRMFNCLSSDTKFITSIGTKSFNDFNNGDTVIVPTHTGEWKPAIVRSYGSQKLFKIVMKMGHKVREIYATENHRWILDNGTATTNIKSGDFICKAPDLFSEFDYECATPFEKLYWCYGYVFGDGTCVQDKNGELKHSMVRLCGEKESKYKTRFEEMGFSTSAPLSCNGDFIAYTGKYLKTAPNPIEDNYELIRAFVDGYCSADAGKNPNWYKNGNCSKYIGIQATGEKYINFIKNCFELAGLYILSEDDLTGQVTNFGTRPYTKRFGIKHSINNHRNSLWRVQSVTETDREEEVWCLEVEDNHSFILSGGIVTGNCSAIAIDHPDAFSEIMFLLLGGSGVGYSVQSHHIDKLPLIKGPIERTRRFLIGDSIEGWADSIKILVEAFFHNKSDPVFDFRGIRKKGARLVTSGGKAPGPDPLRICLEHIRSKLNDAVGRKLTSLEVHDILCYIADAVLSGGIRRAAMISLFSKDDMDLLTCKSGNWWELNPQRGRANNSIVLHRNDTNEDEFADVWERVQASNAGEPGIFWTNDYELLTNPCAEISLPSCSFCNLTEVNVSDVADQQDLNERVSAAAFLGTLQAGYTNFHYLRNIWKENAERDALLGIGMTGIASGAVLKLDLKEAAKVVLETNEKLAQIIGINKAARTTTVKPSGTTSLVLGTSSGIHAWHNDYYIRRMRVGKNEPLYNYIKAELPDLVEDCYYKPHLDAIVSFPQKAPDGAILRTESFSNLLERVKRFNIEWIQNGHREGVNYHNVSCTISLKNNEWYRAGRWMWKNREFYTGISVLPYDGGSYKQPPFSDCTKLEYDDMVKQLHAIDLTKVVEIEDNTNLKGEVSCSGGACEII